MYRSAVTSSFLLTLQTLSLTQCGLFPVHNLRSDPEENMTAGELITSKGYPCEEHYVVTEDGFILNLQRIPHGLHQKPGGPVVFIQHGILASSTNFMLNLANESLPFILADQGLDVWLGNSRGNTYSRNHTHLRPDQKEFWMWSWDEMARYDLPAVVTHVLKTTKQDQLYYIGHSQGTTIAFAGFSENLELQKKIKMLFTLAPVAKVEHIESPIRLLAPYIHKLEELLALFGDYELLPNSPFFKMLADHVCFRDPLICESALFLVAGFDYRHTNKSRMPVYVAQSFEGTSIFDLVHFAQEVESGKFRKYDYGRAENIRRYNQSTPPEYRPERVAVPTAVFSSGRDWLADPRDVAPLLKRLPNVVHKRYVADWNHLDFVMGLDAPQLCYEDIVRLIKAAELGDHTV